MNIVVTIPKKEKKNIEKEREFVKDNIGNVTQFWSMKRRPKSLGVGDKMYFVEDGNLTHYQEVIGFKNDQVCEVTGREWSGTCAVLKCPSVYLDTPIKMKGFQGFRYIDKLPVVSIKKEAVK